MKSRKLRESEELKGVAIERPPFERADDQSAREALADAHRLAQVEVPTRSLRDCQEPLELLPMGFIELVRGEAAGVVDAAENDQRAHLEASGEPVELLTKNGVWPVLFTEYRERYEDLGGDAIAPDLDLVRRCGDRPDIGQGTLAEPKMRQLVCQGEHLRGLGIGSVEEDERGEAVGEGEAAELVGIEAAMIVAAHDAADHDQHSELVGHADEASQRLRPSR